MNVTEKEWNELNKKSLLLLFLLRSWFFFLFWIHSIELFCVLLHVHVQSIILPAHRVRVHHFQRNTNNGYYFIFHSVGICLSLKLYARRLYHRKRFTLWMCLISMYLHTVYHIHGWTWARDVWENTYMYGWQCKVKWQTILTLKYEFLLHVKKNLKFSRNAEEFSYETFYSQELVSTLQLGHHDRTLWKFSNLVNVCIYISVTHKSEFWSLMQANRKKRTYSVQHVVSSCFSFVSFSAVLRFISVMVVLLVADSLFEAVPLSTEHAHVSRNDSV